MWYYCHTCQRRFDAGAGPDAVAVESSESPMCLSCGDGFVEEITASPGAEDAQQPAAPAMPAGTFAYPTAPAAVIRITLPISSAESSTSPDSTPSPPSLRSLPGFVQSILGIFTPTGRGNGSHRRRPTRENEAATESSRTRPRLFPETLQPTFPQTLAATFSTSITEEDLSSPDGLQRLLISLFSQLYDLMAVQPEGSTPQAPAQGVQVEAPNLPEDPRTETPGEAAPGEAAPGQSAPTTPQTPSDMVRMLLQQVLSGQSPIQWVRIPAIPDLLGDYVFGDRAFDDIISSLMEQASGQRAPPPAPQVIIDALPRGPYHSSENVPLECTICREAFVDGAVSISLPCKHLFHEQCIVPWLQLNGTCPICRSSIESNEAQTAPVLDAPTE
ncbi:hypothetical protein DI09_16p290 [Mitosporidium daphniae]|uniref:RING-type domain-containing protein n=1 Tax=Mitosporidium daphniae TaxID=1485682 RepID=A0A098VU55_9MICR|nr:uncharacterized protein DI09_16p290 [Mitosporidium daphniae]KGG52475.1 hypothetical protein DI09_16p290 [Mitosporidium daphniae]|eukprot:XP_013238902.1 uncharacterized protein DI09_16p290 [Mitosporidium daphniae]